MNKKLLLLFLLAFVAILIALINYDYFIKITTHKFYSFSWKNLDSSEYFSLFVNLLMFLFANKLIIKKDTNGTPIRDYSLKVYILRGMNMVFFIAFIVSFILDKKMGANWIQSYLLILASFIFTHWINHWIILRYGDHESVDGEIRITDNYLSQLLKASVILSFILIAAVSLIYIWNMKSLLQSGSAFVTFAIIVFATKEFWMEEVLSSFVIHAKGRLKRGTIIELDDKVYVVLETNFIGTRLKELKTEEENSVPNTFFVRKKIKLLSIEKNIDRPIEEINGKKQKKEWKPIKKSIKFNISYTNSSADVKEYFDAIFQEAQKQNNAIGNFTLNISNNSDYAVEWEVLYYINNPFQIHNIKNTINLIAFEKQKEFNIDLSTPIMYQRT